MKYYLIKVDKEHQPINDKHQLPYYSNAPYVELTEEDIENCLEGVEHFQDRNMEVPDTFDKIRKVLE